jgi:TolA-binding protein
MTILTLTKQAVSFTVALALMFSVSAAAQDEEVEEGKKGFMKRGMSPDELAYNERILELNSLETQISTLEKEFRVLIKKKNQTDDPKQIKPLVKRMKEIKPERDQAVDRYNEIKEEIKYRFPDKGRALIRRFAPMQKKSMKQLEKPTRLREDLTTVKQLVDQKYKTFVDEDRERKKKAQAKQMIRPEVAPSDAPPPKKAILLER